MRKTKMVETVINVMNLILQEEKKETLTSIASSILIIRQGLDVFCKDFDNKHN